MMSLLFYYNDIPNQLDVFRFLQLTLIICFFLVSKSYRRAAFVIEIVGSVASVILTEYLRTANGICCGFCSALAYPYSIGIVCIVYHTASIL